LAGRASEKLIFGKVSTGALNDLERVTKQAYAMVSYFGMSDAVGNISFYDSSGQNEYAFSKPYSEKTADLIDEESKQIVAEQFQRAINVLTENKEGLTRLAEQLLEKEVIFSEDLEVIFGKRKSANAEEQKLLIKANGVGADGNSEASIPVEPASTETTGTDKGGNQLV
jgi:cell division protease FtsH